VRVTLATLCGAHDDLRADVAEAHPRPGHAGMVASILVLTSSRCGWPSATDARCEAHQTSAPSKIATKSVSVLPTSAGGDRADVAARLQLLGDGQRLRRIEAHAVVDGGEQRIQATGAVLQQLLDFHQGVVGGIGTTQDVGLERIEQRDDLVRRVGGGGGDLRSSMAAADTTRPSVR
jgi:hypothetical protein